MANALWDSARNGFLTGLIDYDTATIKAALVSGYSWDATDVMVADLASATLVLPTTLPNKTYVAGVASCTTITFGSPASDPTPYTSIIVFQSSNPGGGSDVGVDQQRLICYIDTLAGNPPVTMQVYPNGTSITFTPDQTSGNGLFKL